MPGYRPKFPPTEVIQECRKLEEAPRHRALVGSHRTEGASCGGPSTRRCPSRHREQPLLGLGRAAARTFQGIGVGSILGACGSLGHRPRLLGSCTSTGSAFAAPTHSHIALGPREGASRGHGHLQAGPAIPPCACERRRGESCRGQQAGPPDAAAHLHRRQ